MYVVYCQNKPKSEFIVAEYDTYFDVSDVLTLHVSLLVVIFKQKLEMSFETPIILFYHYCICVIALLEYVLSVLMVYYLEYLIFN